MKYPTLLIAVLLGGCTAVPLKMDLPEAPAELTKPCPPLHLVEGKEVTLKQFTETVVKNYGLYHGCAASHSGLAEWYRKQREIINGAGK